MTDAEECPHSPYLRPDECDLCKHGLKRNSGQKADGKSWTEADDELIVAAYCSTTDGFPRPSARRSPRRSAGITSGYDCGMRSERWPRRARVTRSRPGEPPTACDTLIGTSGLA